MRVCSPGDPTGAPFQAPMAPALEPLALPQVVRVLAPRRVDAQGHDATTWSRRSFAAAGLDVGSAFPFVQEVRRFTARRGVVRAPSFQVAPEPQNRLVAVLAGAVRAVAVDVRDPTLASYGSWCDCDLDAASGAQLVVPAGFAFGWCTLQPFTILEVKADAFDDEACLRRLAHDDPDLAIAWPGERHRLDLSAEDACGLRLRDLGALDFGRW